MTPQDLKRTCTTHHICDCKQAELEKLREKVRILDEGLEFYDRNWTQSFVDGNRGRYMLENHQSPNTLLLEDMGTTARTTRQKARELDEKS